MRPYLAVAQDLVLGLSSGITSIDAQGTIWMPEVKPNLALCQTNSLLSTIASASAPMSFFRAGILITLPH